MVRHFDDDDSEEANMFDTSSLLEASSSKPPSKGQKLLKTGFLGVAFFGLGLAVAIPGPTLDYLEQQNNVNKERISYIFTARSLGILLGSIVSGILFDKYPTKDKLLIALGLGVTAIALTLSPWTRTLSLLCVCMSVKGTAMGFFATGGNTVCLRMWNKDSGPYLQSLHFTFGVGALVAPLIAAPFFTTVSPEYATALHTNSISIQPAIEHFINKRDYIDIDTIINLPKPIQKNHHTDNSTVVNLPITRNSSMDFPITLNLISTNTEPITDLTNDNLNWKTIPLLLRKPANSGGFLSSDLSDRSGDALGDQISRKKQNLKSAASTETRNNDNSTLPITPDSGGTTEVTSNSSNITTTFGTNTTANDSTTTANPDATLNLSSKNQSSQTTVAKTSMVGLYPKKAGGSQAVSILPETSPTTVTTEIISTAMSTTIAINTATHDKSVLPIVTAASTTQAAIIPSLPTSTIEVTARSKTPQGATIAASFEMVPFSATVSTSHEQHENSTRTPSRMLSPNVRYAYLIIGVVLLVCGISFCLIQCCEREDNKDSHVDNSLKVDNELEMEPSTIFKVIIMIGAFFFFMLYVGIELAYSQFISSFGQAAYGLTEKDGAYLTSTFWTAFTIGRGFSIPLSKYLSPTAQITIALVLSLISAIGLVVTTLTLSSVQFLFMLTALCGIGCAAGFPSGILWIQQHIRVSDKMVTVLVLGSSIGQMWISAVLGYCFVHLGPISLMYMTLGCIIGCAVLFSAMLCMAKTTRGYYKHASISKPAETNQMDDLDFSDKETEILPIIQRSNGAE